MGCFKKIHVIWNFSPVSVFIFFFLGDTKKAATPEIIAFNKNVSVW
jgi:hypothetical protein